MSFAKKRRTFCQNALDSSRGLGMTYQLGVMGKGGVVDT